ncbi:MAG: ATP-binding protein, partial [Candidatus Riflebacteria bacterium]|nr:ATP-binding protein [Candidatus Riflebacteria bacterium]
LVVDEAQKAPGLFEVIKALHDADPRRLSIVITGSSALEIHDPLAETMAGRARIVEIHPFTLGEGFSHAAAEDPTAGELPGLVSRLLTGHFARSDYESWVDRSRWHAAERRRWTGVHLRFPLFPEPCASEEPESWIRDYLITYLEKDVRSLASVGNVTLFRSCLRQVAAHAGSPIKWETMGHRIGTTAITLRKYVGLMEQTFNLIRLAAFGANPVSRVIRAPKLYFIDPGLFWGVRGFEDLRLLEASGMLGTYMELAAIAEIAKWCSLEPTAPELRFWQKTAVSEVDLVVSNRGYHIPFEIKIGKKLDSRWVRGLDAFEADNRSIRIEVPYRIIIHTGDPEQLDERTYALPLWMFA